MYKLTFIAIIILVLVSCQDNTIVNFEKKSSDTVVVDNAFEDTISVPDSNLIDSIIQPAAISFSTKALVVLVNSRSQKSVSSLTIKNKDSISQLIYLNTTFDTSKIDSIQFIGSVGKYLINPRHQQMGSMLVVHFEDHDTAEDQLNQLNTNYSNNFRGVEAMFKSGGICFAVNRSLCIFSVEACARGYASIKEMDSIIAKDIFDNTKFKRLHSTCGMNPFKVLNL